jgi:hypothetical protein
MTITTQSFTAINVGTTANDGTGDDLRTAFIKVNDNFQYMGNTGFNAGNIYAPTGTVQAAYFIGDGGLLTNIAGGGGGASNYSNVNVAAYLNTSGYNLYSNVNVANYLPSYTGVLTSSNVYVAGNVTAQYVLGSGQFLTGLPAGYSNTNVIAYLNATGYNLYSNVNVAAYLNNNGAVPIGTSSTIYANAGTQSTSVGTGALVVTGGVGISGNLTVGNLTVLGTQTTVSATSVAVANSFIFLSNNNITNAVDIGFVGQYNEGLGNVYTGLTYRAADGIYRLFSNLSPAPSLTVNLASAVYSAIQVGNIIAGNVIGVNFLGSGAYLTTLPGYAYSNVNVAAYTETMGFQNYGNINVAAYVTSMGVTNFSNVNVAALITTNGLTNYSNVNVAAYVTSMGVTNFSNVNVAAYLTTGPIGTTGIIYANSGTQSTSVGTGALVVTGGAGISGNLTVGNLTVLGTQTTVSATSVNLSNSFIFLSNNNITNTVDIGFVGQYNAGQGNVYTGLAYRAADGIYRLFSNVSPQPSLTVNLASAVYSAIQVGNIIAANVTVNTVVASNVYVNGNVLANYGTLTSLNTTGNILATGLSVFGNTRIGSLATPGALHTIIGNVDVSGAGTEYFNIGGNILAVQASFGSINTTGNISASVANFGAGNVAGFAIGYRDVPQVTVANLTLIASDAGKHYYGANTNPTTITIPTNANVAFGNGTAISIVNQGTGNITVANAAGVLLYLAGNSTAGSRTLTSYGMATLIKVQVNTWFINGTGVV